MTMVPLKDFAKGHGQPHAASLLGMTQGALSKAIRIGRTVYVTQQPDGSFAAIEVRSFPARHDREASYGPTLDQTILQLASAVETGKPSVYSSSTGGVQ
ncbi:MAG: Cro/CI family transcriptional regulator [Pseudomonas sp.]|uniref:Cro/CI family transcriptional regulator n=1 Tax=Pseudomonas TaxID=286 RepID=UPI0003C0B844|nr:Cro/CI family transcriptional regulator [Pseudomonas sp. VLB120]AGZ36558.1 regulatory protein cro [Pseudomonas sp. VLB120]